MEETQAIGFRFICTVTLLLMAMFIPSVCAETAPTTAKAVAEQCSGETTLKADGYGVPHIFSDCTYGLFYGLGYAVATDRLYQMDIARRIGSGTVAAVLGSDYVAIDKVTLSSFDPDTIRRQMVELDRDDHAIFEGYAAGINARIKEVLANKKALLPRGYITNDFEPTLWQPDDIVMVWVGMILNRFFAGTAEVQNLRLRTVLQSAKGSKVGEQIFHQLRWLTDPTAPTIIPRALTSTQAAIGGDAVTDISGTTSSDGSQHVLQLAGISADAARRHHQGAATLMGDRAASIRPVASNAWVVSPELTETGFATLYNGPQQGYYTPSFVYTVGLHGAGYDAVGSVSVGLPAIFFGTNGTIAWGSTVGALDTNDVYQEQLDPENPHQYMYKGSYRPMQKHTVTIRVKDADDVTMDVYSTVHGFVHAWDLENDTAYTHKRSWEGDEVDSLVAWTEAAKADNWKEFLQYGSHVGTSITWFYADAKGNIGTVGLGYLPDRPANQSIQFPANGNGTMEWKGLLPFTENPKAYNPPQGYFASWNNLTAGDVRSDWANYSHVDRVNEILEIFDNEEEFSTQEIWQIAKTVAYRDVNARYFTDDLADMESLDGNSPAMERAIAAVEKWDGSIADENKDGYFDAKGLTVYRTWLGNLYKHVFKDDLPESVYKKYAWLGYPTARSGSVRPGPAVKLLWNALSEDSGVPQTYDFLNGQDVALLMQKALADTIDELGSDSERWQTPVVPMEFNNGILGVPWAPENKVHTASIHMNRGTLSYLVVMNPSSVSFCNVIAPGQSGFVSADGTVGKHYDDQWDMYVDFKCKNESLDGDVDAQTRTLEYEF